MEIIKNQTVLDWINAQVDLTKPDQVVWIDGSEAQLEALRQQACSTGEIYKLNEEKLPGCYLHRSDPTDVARVESRTFICCERQEDAGPTNNWMAPAEMYAKLNKLYDGSMKGRTMYVIPYCMGVVGSPFAKYGIELTDSIYVVLNMAIMTRVGAQVADYLDEGFIKGLHSKGTLDPEERYIVQFPEDNAIMSINSGYGGNVLQGKKCFALRIASACGKTNLAMLIPPEGYRKNGWKCWCVGDDIAWLRPGPDGRLWAVNPEKGFFGVAPGTNANSNPNALATTQKGTIFTGGELPLHLSGVQRSPGSAHLRHDFRRAAGEDGTPGVPVPQLAARGLYGLHYGLGEDCRGGRHRRRDPPGPHGHAALLRLSHGRLLAALVGYGKGPHQPTQDLQRQLVPDR